MSEEAIIKTIHGHMVHAARKDNDDEDSLVFYSKIIHMADIGHYGEGVGGALGHIFYEINEYDRAQDPNRPMLSAVAVSSEEMKPGRGFYDLARDYRKYRGKSEREEFEFWLKELKALRDYWQVHSITNFKGVSVTYQAVHEALQDFDEQYPNPSDYDQWIDKDGYKYALEFAGRLYPPKHILSVVTGIDVSRFSGGDQTNRVFQQLGLVVVEKPTGTTNENLYLLTEEDRAIIAQTMELTFREGGKILISSYQYERDIRARQACIRHYGFDCFVCGFNFAHIFGEIGENFIHVHHLNPLSQQDEEHEINPIDDLRPVCPNCHAMLHKRNPPYSIAELQDIRQQTTKQSKV
ncbi:MAG: HNH endonuclease [Chloroflexota bacterium]